MVRWRLDASLREHSERKCRLFLPRQPSSGGSDTIKHLGRGSIQYTDSASAKMIAHRHISALGLSKDLLSDGQRLERCCLRK